MKRGKAMAFGLGALALLVAPHACNQFTELPATAEDASTDAPVATSSSSSASSSGQSPPSVPPWQPSFAADDVDAGAVLATVGEVCPQLPDAGGPITSSFGLTSLCVGTTAFVQSFQQYCTGLSIVPGKVLVRASAGIVNNGDGTVTRTGIVRMGAELDAPCRPTAAGGCGNLETLVTIGLKSKGISVRCYDTPASASSCVCQMDATLNLQDDNPLPVDTSTGMFSNDYLYGKESADLVYTGKPKDDPNKFTVEPAFRWTLAPE